MFQAGPGLIAGVGAVTVDDAGIPRCTRVHDLVTRFLSSAVPVQNRLGPWFSIPEPGFVVIGKYAEDGRSETDRGQLLYARCRYLLSVIEAQPTEMRRVDKFHHAGIHCGHH